jgi:hypothetical protein
VLWIEQLVSFHVENEQTAPWRRQVRESDLGGELIQLGAFTCPEGQREHLPHPAKPELPSIQPGGRGHGGPGSEAWLSGEHTHREVAAEADTESSERPVAKYPVALDPVGESWGRILCPETHSTVARPNRIRNCQGEHGKATPKERLSEAMELDFAD